MNRRLLHSFLLALIAACAVAHAADEAPTKRGMLVDLLDPSRPAADRQSALATVDKRALTGDASSQYILGSLYRVGEKLPGNLLPADPDKAWRYLSNAAGHGHTRAMAKMAELELERQHPMEAMLWAQIYAHYLLEGEPQRASDKRPGNGYLANLLRRAYLVFDPAQEELMQKHFAAFLAAHDKDIKAGIAAVAAERQSSPTQPHITHLQYDSRTTPLNDDLADFLIAFAPDGSAAQVWMLDAVPDFALGRQFEPLAKRMRINAIGANEGMRYALLPLEYSTNLYELKRPPRSP